MIFPPHVVGVVADCAEWADRLIRADLIGGYIATENDYTSNFTGAFRREINSRAVPGLQATALVLRPTIERMVGADACFVFASSGRFKLGVFEAKWPRLTIDSNSWDSLQRSSKLSHFHEQLRRQKHLLPHVAVWEMFYLEHAYGGQPSYAPAFGSACVWHRDAVNIDAGRSSSTIWTDSELDVLLGASCLSIQEIVSQICICNEGGVLSGTDFVAPLADFGSPHEILLIEYDQGASRLGEPSANL